MENNEIQVNEGMEVAPQKKSNKKIVVMGIVAVLVIAITSTVLFAKSPKTVFFSAIANSAKQWEKEKNDWLQSEEGSLFTYLANNPAHMTYDISVNVGGSIFDDSQQMILDLLKTTKLAVDSYTDTKNNRSMTTLALKNQGAQLIDAQVLQLDKKVGVKVPLLYPKFFYFDGDKMGETMRALDPSVDTIDKLPDWKETEQRFIALTEKGKDIQKTYTTFLMEQLKNENFTVANNATVQINSVEAKGKKVTLHLSDEEFMNIMNALIEKVENDQVAQDYIVEYAKEINTLISSTDPTFEQADETQIRESIKQALTEMKEGLKSFDLPKGIDVAFVVDGKNNIINTAITFDIHDKEYDETVAFLFELGDYEDANRSTYRGLNCAITDGQNQFNLQGQWDTLLENNIEKNQIKLVGKEQEELFNVALDSEKTKEKEGSKTTANYKLSTYDDVQLSGTYTCDSVGSVKANKIDNDITFTANIATEGETVDLGFQIKEVVELGVPFNWPELTGDNSVDLLNVSDEEMAQIEQEIQGAIMGLAMQLMPLF